MPIVNDQPGACAACGRLDGWRCGPLPLRRSGAVRPYSTWPPADLRSQLDQYLDRLALDAVVRLVRLVEFPSEARVMQPLVTREIVYRLLRGAQGDRLRHLTQLGGTTTRIASAVHRLRTDFDKPLRIEHIASDLGMSVSGFHAQFKAVTAPAITAIAGESGSGKTTLARLLLGP
jgi:hypothetical protein